MTLQNATAVRSAATGAPSDDPEATFGRVVASAIQEPLARFGREQAQTVRTLEERLAGLSSELEDLKTAGVPARPGQSTQVGSNGEGVSRSAVGATNVVTQTDTRELAERTIRGEELRRFTQDEEARRARAEGIAANAYGTDNKSFVDELQRYDLGVCVLGELSGWNGLAKELVEYRITRDTNDMFLQRGLAPAAATQRDKAIQALGVDSLGGFMVPPTYMVDRFIPALEERLFLSMLGVTTMVNLPGVEVNIPREGKQPDALTWGDELSSPQEVSVSFDQMTLRKHYAKALIQAGKRWIRTWGGASDWINNRLVRQMTEGLEVASIYGLGAAGQPTGLLNKPGRQTFDWSATGTFGAVQYGTAGNVQTITPRLDAIFGLLEDAFADRGNVAHLFPPAVRRKLRNVKDTTGVPIMAAFLDKSQESTFQARTAPERGSIMGVPYVTSQLLQASTFLTGAWQDFYLALFETMFVEVNPGLSGDAFKRGYIEILGQMAVDFGIAHEESFVETQSFT
jgi:HK97 family phage major capsid protein